MKPLPPPTYRRYWLALAGLWVLVAVLVAIGCWVEGLPLAAIAVVATVVVRAVVRAAGNVVVLGPEEE